MMMMETLLTHQPSHMIRPHNSSTSSIISARPRAKPLPRLPLHSFLLVHYSFSPLFFFLESILLLNSRALHPTQPKWMSLSVFVILFPLFFPLANSIALSSSSSRRPPYASPCQWCYYYVFALPCLFLASSPSIDSICAFIHASFASFPRFFPGPSSQSADGTTTRFLPLFFLRFISRLLLS